MDKISKMGTTALIISGIAVPAALLLSRIFEYFVKFINPEKLDISQNLAYVGSLLIISALIMFGLLAIAFFLSSMTYLRREKNIGKIALSINIINLLLVIGALLFQVLINQITD